MLAMSDEEIMVAIEDAESDGWDDSVAELEAERLLLDSDARAERVAQWRREEPVVTCEELPRHLLTIQATAALNGLADRIVRTGTIPAHRLHVWALAWMRRVNAIEHGGAIEDGGSLWHRSRHGWLKLSEWGLSLKVAPGEVEAIAAARAIPEPTAEERRREHDKLVSRMERVRRQREARERVDEAIEAQEAARYGFGRVEA